MSNKERNVATSAELTRLVILLEKFRFDYKLYKQVLRANHFSIERSVDTIEEKEKNDTRKLLNSYF